jgi:hypothetical protein
MADIFFFAIAFYFLYKLVLDFIVPVYKATTQAKSQFRDIHQNRQPPPANDFQQPRRPAQETKNNNGKIGEYIEFEEVKEK